jgi:RimJ/RimL family protein N-acetyltransferase
LKIDLLNLYFVYGKGDIVMVLETNRLILRDWNKKDIEDLAEGLNNIEVSKWLVQIPYPYTQEHAQKFIEYCINSADDKNRSSYDFAIELKADNKVIGGTSINRINRQHGTACGGIWVNAKYHGHGYGTEAWGKRIEFAFIDLNLRRLENGFLDGNQASFKMQEKFGYVIEGKRRKGFLCIADGKLKDENITSLLIDEWKK